MKLSLKYLSLLLAALFLIAGTMLIAFAEGEDGGDTPAEPIVEPVDSEPIVEPDPVIDPDPIVDPEPVVEPDPVVDPNQGGDYSGGTGTDTNTDYNYNNNYYTEDPIFYGNASNYDYNTSGNNDGAAGSVTQQTQLYSTSGLSAEEAKPNEWSEITLDEKTVKTGVADFSSIKTNTEKEDDSQWILYLGYALLILAALGILYFIVATIAARHTNKKAERMERRYGTAPARSEAARMEERDRRAENAGTYRTSHFADEYSPRKRVSAKADTGEIYIPRRTRAK